MAEERAHVYTYEHRKMRGGSGAGTGTDGVQVGGKIDWSAAGRVESASRGGRTALRERPAAMLPPRGVSRQQLPVRCVRAARIYTRPDGSAPQSAPTAARDPDAGPLRAIDDDDDDDCMYGPPYELHRILVVYAASGLVAVWPQPGRRRASRVMYTARIGHGTQ